MDHFLENKLREKRSRKQIKKKQLQNTSSKQV